MAVFSATSSETTFTFYNSANQSYDPYGLFPVNNGSMDYLPSGSVTYNDAVKLTLNGYGQEAWMSTVTGLCGSEMNNNMASLNISINGGGTISKVEFSFYTPVDNLTSVTADSGTMENTNPSLANTWNGSSQSVNFSFNPADGMLFYIATLKVTYDGGEIPTVDIPVILNADREITITDATSGTQIYYTTDGSEPTRNSTLYNGPIAVTGNSFTIKAIAGLGGNVSKVAVYNSDSQTDIKSISINGSEEEEIYYNLHGIRISNPSNGVFIHKSSSGKIIKVLL